MAADAKGVEKVATTCAVIHKTRYLFSDLQQKNERFICSHCPMLPVQYFISKKFKNWNLKASFSVFKGKFLSLDFHNPSWG